MTEYISREEALNFELSVEADPEDIQAITKGMALYADYIKNIPAASVVKQKKGRWIHRKIEPQSPYMPYVSSIELVCSKCKNHAAWEFSFCPNCGAEMKP